MIMFETPYLFNMLDGKSYPLLADGDWVWNDAKTEITYKIKSAAKWSDGTPVTADDVGLYLDWPTSSTRPIPAITLKITSTPSKPRIPRRWWSRLNWMRTAKRSILC